MKIFALLLTFLSTHVMGLELPSQTEMDLGPFGPFPKFAPVKHEIVCERKPGTDYILCEYVPQSAKSPDLTIHDAEITEGDYESKLLKFNLSLSNPSSKEVKVKFGTIDNTALASQDYESTSGVVVFPPGIVNQEIHVTVYGDTLYADEDGTETFFVNLHSVRGANLNKNQAVGTITNDDMTMEESLDDLKAILRPFYTDLREQDRYGKEIPIDLGGDGDQDLIVLVASTVQNEANEWLVEAYPLSYFVNNEGNGFERVDTDIDMHSRYYEAADVNGDGLDDLISVADHQIHEVYGQIYREDYVRLLVQTENGELIDSSDSVDEIYADWHGLTVLDIELDGDIDFIATGLHDSLYAFMNDGSGNFTITEDNLPLAGLHAFSNNGGGWPQHNRSRPSPDYNFMFTNLHAVDLNNDGYKEVLLGVANFPGHFPLRNPSMPILRNDNGTFTFDYVTDTLDVLIPDVEGDSVPSVLDMKDIDINGDGCTDLLIHNTDYQENSAITTYYSDCKGSLSEVFHYQFLEAGWIEKFYIADVTGDGLDDFYGVRNISVGHLDLFTNDVYYTDTYTPSSMWEIAHPDFDLATYVRIMLWK